MRARAGISPGGRTVEVDIMRGVPTVSMENSCIVGVIMGRSLVFSLSVFFEKNVL
jgi:hypothetical protein